jgi:hypothetical protein
MKQSLVPTKPDIYHFIFDSYTNSETLNKYWNYSNPVDSFLTKQGFRVIPGSVSNYDFTPFSVGSVFNLQYLSNSERYLGRNGKNFYIGRMAFQENELFHLLKANKYTLNNFSLLDTIEYLQKLETLGPKKPVTWLRNQTLERLHLNPWIKYKVLRKLYKTNLPPDIIKSYEAYRNYHQKAINYFKRSVANSRNHDTPNFYFIHFFVPHEPYIFNEKGVADYRTLKRNDMQGYLRQIKYSNTLIELIVSTLAKDPKEKIIIIQGDHGYRKTEYGMTRTDQFASYNAIYFHDSNYKNLYKGMSLVNTYRVVLNNYFNYDLPLLKDSIFLPAP